MREGAPQSRDQHLHRCCPLLFGVFRLAGVCKGQYVLRVRRPSVRGMTFERVDARTGTFLRR